MRKAFIANVLIAGALIGGWFGLSNASADSLPLIAIASSNLADKEVRSSFDIFLSIYPGSFTCKSTQISLGYQYKSVVKGTTNSSTLRVVRVESFRISEKLTVNPETWQPGKYEITPLIFDACGNRAAPPQVNVINVTVPSITTFQVTSPLFGNDFTIKSTLGVSIKYDPYAATSLVEAMPPRLISIYSPTLSKDIFSCKNLVPDKNSEIANLYDFPQQNCGFIVKPFAGYYGTYQWELDSNGWPGGIHEIQITLQDLQGNQFKSSTRVLVPTPTTTSIQECQQTLCAKKFSGRSTITILGNVDPQSNTSIRDVSLQVNNVNLSNSDSQGNPYIKAEFTGTQQLLNGVAAWSSFGPQTRFPITLDTSSWGNGSYVVTASTTDSRGTKSQAVTTISVENSGPSIDANSVRVPKGDVQETVRMSLSASPPTGSSAKIKSVQVLVNGKAVTEGLLPDFKFTAIRNDSWEISPQNQLSWIVNFAKPKDILEKRQAGFFSLSVDGENASGKYSDTFQFLITDTNGRQTTSPVYQSEISCNPCKKLVLRDSSVSAQGGDVSKEQTIGFDVEVPAQAISTASQVRVLRDGKPITEGLEPLFDNSGIRNDGWAIAKGSKFTWKMKFGSSDQIVFDNQKGFWNVPVADDPDVDPRIASTLAFEVIDNFGRVTASSVIPNFLITCLECENRIRNGLKNIRLAKRYARDAQSALESIDTYLSTAQGYQSSLNGMSSKADDDKKNSEKAIKELTAGKKLIFTIKNKKVPVTITEVLWDKRCSNQRGRPDGEKILTAAKGSYDVSVQSWNAFRNDFSTVNSSVGTIKDRRSSSATAYNRLKNIANSEVVSNDQVKEAKALLEEILRYEKDSSGEVGQARNGKESAESKLSEINQVKEINKQVNYFFNSAKSCIKFEDQLTSTQGSIDGDKSSTKTKTNTAIRCVAPNGTTDIVKGPSPKCKPGYVKKSY